LDGAWRSGHNPAEIATALELKQGRNEQRQWPDWRENPNGAIEHIKEKPAGGDHAAAAPGGGAALPATSPRGVNQPYMQAPKTTGFWRVMCWYCTLQGKTKEEAAELWNRRTPAPVDIDSVVHLLLNNQIVCGVTTMNWTRSTNVTCPYCKEGV